MSPTNSRSGDAPRYQSPLRAAQAAATCRLILDAAGALFTERGYAATSIDAIAAAAGVGRSTVFSAAGVKPRLLKSAYDRAVVGDDEPVPLLARPPSMDILAIADSREMLTAYAALINVTAARVAAIYEVICQARGADSDIEKLWDEIRRQRLAGARLLVGTLHSRGQLRRGLAAARAADVVWVHNDPSLRSWLVGARGWSSEQYCAWLAASLQYQLLGGDPSGDSRRRRRLRDNRKGTVTTS